MKQNKTRKVNGGTRRKPNDADATTITRIIPLKTKTGKPSYFRKDFVSVVGILDTDEAVQGEIVTAQPKVVVTTKKKVGTTKKLLDKVKRTLGIRTRNTDYDHIDFNLKMFKGTCLEGNAISVADLSVISNLIEPFRTKERKIQFIQGCAPNFCRLKERIFQKDIDFDAKYPHTYKTLIRLIFTDDFDAPRQELLNAILRKSPNELVIANYIASGMQFGEGDFEMNVNRALYDIDQDNENRMTLLSRAKGGTRKNKK